MTLTTDHNRLSYTANGVTAVYPYTFLVLTQAEMLVYVNDVLQASNAYTVSNLGVGSGGNVTLSAIPTAGARVDLLRATDPTQQVNLQEGDKLPAEQVEGIFDKVYALVQDLAETVSRAFKIPPTGATATTEPTVPNLVTLAGQVLKVNATGTGLEGVTVLSTDVVTPITTKGDLIRGSTTNTAERLPIGTSGQVLTVVSGNASWVSTSGTAIPANILTAKGDIIVATSGSTPAKKGAGSSGGVLTTDASTADGLNWVVGAALHGRVRLRYDSPTQLTLIPWNGSSLYVKDASGWRVRSLASAGLVASNTSTFVDGTGASALAASTDYLVTVFDNAGTLALDFLSTLTHAPDLSFGIETGTANETRTVVGRIRTTASSQFADAERTRFVLNWFNRRPLYGTSSYTTGRTTASTTFVEPHIEIRTEFLTWAEDAIAAGSAGSYAISTSQVATTGLAFDGTTPVAVIAAGSSNKDANSAAITWMGLLAEGYHYLTMVGAVESGATGTWSGTDTGGDQGKCRVFVMVQG